MPTVTLGEPVVATLAIGDPLPAPLGARIEEPISRAIVSRWQPADDDQTVTLDGPTARGGYLLVWLTADGTDRAFVPVRVDRADPMTVTLGEPVEVAVPPPPGFEDARSRPFGAEIRVPVTGEVVVAWEEAPLSSEERLDACGQPYTHYLTTVTLPSPADAGEYVLVFRRDDDSVVWPVPFFVDEA